VRFYKIVVSDPTTNAVKRTYTSFFNNAVDPGALNVVLDIPIAPGHVPAGTAYVEVQGIDYTDISSSSNFNKDNIAVMAGMSKGLPLATAQFPQQGLILQGQIQQCYANWVGTLMSLNFVMNTGPQTSATSPDSGTDPASQQNNIVLNWTRGVPLGAILKNCLEIAFPGYTVKVNISQNLLRPNNDTSIYDNLRELASFIQSTTQALIGGTYPGVSITLQGRVIFVTDNTPSAAAPTQIAFQDLIGQPTWTGPFTIQVTTVMRGDLDINDTIMLPQTPLVTQAASFSNYKTKPNFANIKYSITGLRHVGDFRQPDGSSWATVIDCVDNSGS
jgi:hypothetical protein